MTWCVVKFDGLHALQESDVLKTFREQRVALPAKSYA